MNLTCANSFRALRFYEDKGRHRCNPAGNRRKQHGDVEGRQQGLSAAGQNGAENRGGDQTPGAGEGAVETRGRAGMPGIGGT